MINSQSCGPLKILAQPRATYRERYASETDPKRSKGYRFIRADLSPDQHFEYPTIEIPQEWKDQTIYIRVTPVTVTNEKISHQCIHPYSIDTPESAVVRDVGKNALYFPIVEKDFLLGHKSFRLTRKKLTKNELKNHIPLRLFNSHCRDNREVKDTRELINIYQLNKFQLVFSVAQFCRGGQVPVVFNVTSVFSNVIVADPPTHHHLNLDALCAPQQSDWRGDDRILMVIPRLDRRRAFQICLRYFSIDKTIPINATFIDSKTLLFRTPPCFIDLKENDILPVTIVVTQNYEEIARIPFQYRSTSLCSNCRSIVII